MSGKPFHPILRLEWCFRGNEPDHSAPIFLSRLMLGAQSFRDGGTQKAVRYGVGEALLTKLYGRRTQPVVANILYLVFVQPSAVIADKIDLAHHGLTFSENRGSIYSVGVR